MHYLRIYPARLKRKLLTVGNRQWRERAGLGGVPASPAVLAQIVTRLKWRPSRHLMLLNEKLVELAEGKLRRLIVEAPPRHGKSQLCSIYMPAWYLGRFPDREVIVTSATDDLATDFSRATRDVLLEHGTELFGVKVRRDVRHRRRFALAQGGSLRAAGVGGGIMGRGAHLLIIDDYIKDSNQARSETWRRGIHQWYSSTSSTRLTADGAVLIIATRWHRHDLIGQLLDEQEKGGDRWQVVRLPALAEEDDPLGRSPGAALWPERFPRRWLLKKKAAYIAGGLEWIWEALYQQNPPRQMESEWPERYFDDVWFDAWPAADEIVWRVLALDPSLGKGDKADYSAFVMLAVDRHGMLWVEADLARRDSSRTVDEALALARRFRPDAFGVETNQFQELLADLLAERARKAGMLLPLYSVPHRTSKVSRIRSLTPHLAKGSFRFKSDSPGTALLVEQLRGFPFMQYDDGPDALEMAVRLAGDLMNAPETGGPDEPPERVRAV